MESDVDDTVGVSAVIGADFDWRSRGGYGIIVIAIAMPLFDVVTNFGAK